MAQKPTAKKSAPEDPRYTQALQSYEAGLRAMQEHYGCIGDVRPSRRAAPLRVTALFRMRWAGVLAQHWAADAI